MNNTQKFCDEIWRSKYAAPGEENREDSFQRVARFLSNGNINDEKEFYRLLIAGCIPGGRIMANAGTQKKNTSLINCTVSGEIDDSIEGILTKCLEAGKTLHTGAGIGYCFSSLRPSGAYVSGVGAHTSGSISFMHIFDTMCGTISSAGGRRGAQMGTMHIWHPDIENFIEAKRTDRSLRKFNLSVLVTDEFMNAVLGDEEWDLWFPVYAHHPVPECDQKDTKSLSDFPFNQEQLLQDRGRLVVQIYRTVKARDLWDKIMKATYEYAEPGVLFIDTINRLNPLNGIEQIVATNPCGEQPLPPYGACLLGSIDLSRYVHGRFSTQAFFDYSALARNTESFTTMLDRVIEHANLPLKEQTSEILSKRRMGIGVMGLGTALAYLGIRYGSKEACEVTDLIFNIIALSSYSASCNARSPAPILTHGENGANYLRHIKEYGIGKFIDGFDASDHDLLPKNTHRLTVAPTGTTAIAFGGNCSSGIEPTFSHEYIRNVIEPGRKTKVAHTIQSAEALSYLSMNPGSKLPEYFTTADDVTPYEHIDMQAAAQKWVDSSISKTINVPTSTTYEQFKDIYLYAYEKGLKGVTTFRYNPAMQQGVLVRESDLNKTRYRFTLASGSSLTLHGHEEVTYLGESTTAANLFESLKEGHHGNQ